MGDINTQPTPCRHLATTKVVGLVMKIAENRLN